MQRFWQVWASVLPRTGGAEVIALGSLIPAFVSIGLAALTLGSNAAVVLSFGVSGLLIVMTLLAALSNAAHKREDQRRIEHLSEAITRGVLLYARIMNDQPPTPLSEADEWRHEIHAWMEEHLPSHAPDIMSVSAVPIGPSYSGGLSGEARYTIEFIDRTLAALRAILQELRR